MAKIRPFMAIRPKKDMAKSVAALPYDVMSSDEARVMVESEPYSFLRIDRAEVNFPVGTDIYSDEVYEKAASLIGDWRSEGVLIQDDTPCYYLYMQTMDGREQTGLVCVCPVEDYDAGKIKKHELTRAEKEEDRKRHVDVCNANTGPIFLTYRKNDDVSALVKEIKNLEPEYDFVSDDGIRHTVWLVNDEESIAKLTDAMSQVDGLYIADGHHRCASACSVGRNRRAENPNSTGEEEFNYFLAVLFPDEELKIFDYNRAVKDLNGNTPEEFLTKLEELFDISKSDDAVRPNKKGCFGMYLDGSWYELNIHPEMVEGRVGANALDVSVLQDLVLAPILNIGDPRTDDRISFIGGIRGLSELERVTDKGVAFSMYPTGVEELMEIADSGEIMPPKSTWFEPKLRSGLFIHEL